MMGMKETGELDTETMAMMNQPRCGDPDMPDAMKKFGGTLWHHFNRYKRYTLQGVYDDAIHLTTAISLQVHGGPRKR